MQSLSEFLGGDHKACDRLFASAEEEVAHGRWEVAAQQHSDFISAMESHFGMEEEGLFPAFEQTTGQTMGPTQVMRHEHTQMRQLFAEMGQALSQRDADGYLGASETLLILMQQHNAKEEQILYPMSDRVLASEREALLERLAAIRSGV